MHIPMGGRSSGFLGSVGYFYFYFRSVRPGALRV
jgi:hypothetical protein